MRVSAQRNASGSASHVDSDPTETREWVESLESVMNEAGTDRALFLLDELEEQLRRKGVRASVQPYSAYRNTIPVDNQGGVRAPFLPLGTDGFGRSDTRAVLRDFFEIDRKHIAVAALSTLVENGHLDRQVLRKAIAQYGIKVERAAPWTL